MRKHFTLKPATVAASALSLLIAGGVVLGFGSPASAVVAVTTTTIAPVQSPSLATVTATGLQVSATAPDFAVVLNGANQNVSAQSTTGQPFVFDIQDATGSGTGWSLSVNETDFVSGAYQIGAAAGDQQTGPGAEVSITSVLSPSTCDTNSGCMPAVNSATIPVTIPGTAVLVYNAAINTGMGEMTTSEDATLPVPADTYAKDYTSIWTITLASGPGGV